MITRPLLAGNLSDMGMVKFPVIASRKLDGIRCLKINGSVVTRKFKPIPNVFVRETLEKLVPDGVDGELMIKNCRDFNEIQSQIMSFEGTPEFEYHIFDYVKDDLNKKYRERLQDLTHFFTKFTEENPDDTHIKMVENYYVHSIDRLLDFEERFVSEGYEGVMIRSYDGRYKCGRSTEKEGILLKLKRFFDAEATVIGFQEQMKNENDQEADEFGLSKRSSKKEGLIPSGTLGSLSVKFLHEGKEIEFSIGSGINDSLKKKIWDNQSQYINQLVKFKYQEMGKDAPRFPVFLGFRHKSDT